MIIKGNPAGSAKFWSKHLLRDDTNERAVVKEIKGLLAEDLPSALREMKAIGDQSRSHGNSMYQANINPRDDEHLTPEQWKEAVDTLEKNLGLEGHQRVVVEHVKNGRQHYHIIWNRVDVDTLRVSDMGGNWHIHEKTARELEAKFGLTPTPTPTPEQLAEKKSAPELYEIRAAERSGIEPAALKAELTELWNRTDSGQAFASAVEQHGFILAKGDRRDFCIIDEAGDAHSLARRLDGVKAKDVRERMADVDRDSLPTVAEARDAQVARRQERGDQAPAKDQLDRDDALKQLKAADSADRQNLRATENDAFWKERREKRDQATAQSTERWEKYAKGERARIDPIDIEGAAKGTALAVVDASGRVAGTLVDFVGGLLSGVTKPQAANDFTSAEQVRQIRAQRRAVAAMENIRESSEGLKPEDVQNLLPIHLVNIKAKGDDFLRELVETAERQRARDLEWGRTMER